MGKKAQATQGMFHYRSHHAMGKGRRGSGALKPESSPDGARKTLWDL